MNYSRNRAIVFAIVHSNMPLNKASIKFGLSTRQIRRIISKYKKEGEESLLPVSRASKTHANAIQEDIIQRIVILREQLTTGGWDAGAKTIHTYLLKELEPSKVPSISTIWRILQRSGKIIPEPKKRPKTSYIRFQADYPNETWQSDSTHWTISNSEDIEITTWIDDNSRYILNVKAYKTTTVHTIIETFLDSAYKNGLPTSILTDNGLVYTTRLSGGKKRNNQPNSFEQLLDNLGIKAKHGRPAHPTTQGKIERYHQTLKRWLKAQPVAKTIEELNLLLQDFQTLYNQTRPHQSLNNITPQEAYTSKPKVEPIITDNNKSQWRVRVDKVDECGKVTLRWGNSLRHLGVGRAWKRTPIVMLVHANQATVIHQKTGEILGEYTLDPNKNYQKRT